MTLVKDIDTRKFDITKLDEQEKKIMCLFLESEKERHEQDIIDIERIIAYLKDNKERCPLCGN